MSLDGETSLKSRKAILGTKDDGWSDTPETSCAYLCENGKEMVVHAEIAHKKLDRADATVAFSASPRDVPDVLPASVGNFIYRGAVVRNSEWVVGLIVYAGESTKLRLNASPTPAKVSQLQHSLNRMVIMLVSSLLATTAYLALQAVMAESCFWNVSADLCPKFNEEMKVCTSDYIAASGGGLQKTKI